ncbi:MAG: TonB-dependent receptor, partial [Burkholderiales bacterium]|nr:TonB-dependent receptor [Burkholderiales bacterium]
SAVWKTDSTFTMGRLFGNWISKIGDGRLDTKFGVNSFYFEAETPRQEFFLSGAPQQTLYDRTSTRERGANLSSKYSISIGEGHLLAAGVEGEWSKRIQTRLALVNGVPDAFNDAGDDDLSASSRRYAAFVQDEWDINKQWSVNLGLRWEGINVKSAATGKLAAVDNQSSVLSPIAHAVWKIPGMERDQVRMSATHSYRAPPLANLIAAPALSHNNSATSPDRYGNPNLKPEQAIGLELAYEHYLSDGGIVSVNFFNRHIKQLMRRVAKEENTVDGLRWISRPVNIGNADTRGVELEAKFRLAQWMENAPNIDLRANYSWAWSAVDGINGPYNRIDSQPKHTANLGIDYRPANSALSLGGSLNWTPGYLIQTSPEQLTSSDLKRQLDVYALWKINGYTQLRLSANNLMARDSLSSTSVQDRGITHLSDSLGPTDTQWSLRLEMKL